MVFGGGTNDAHLTRATAGKEMKPLVISQAAAEQIIGREGETATFVIALRGFFRLVWWRFRPTSIQSLGGYRLHGCADR